MGKNLDKLKQKRSQINARIQKLEASEKAKSRKQETRRKILVGAYYLQKAREEGSVDVLNQCMDDYLKRDIDKALFELAPEKVEEVARAETQAQVVEA